jgi:hypothetical protein
MGVFSRFRTDNALYFSFVASGRKKKKERPVVGWREWVGLPGLGLDALKAKIDTGARSSALHAFDMRFFERGGQRLVCFKVHPLQRDRSRVVECEAEMVDERGVRNSGGVREVRPVICTELALMDRRFVIEITLTNRDAMGYRMLLGREALRRRFVVDAGRSFLAGKPDAAEAE